MECCAALSRIHSSWSFVTTDHCSSSIVSIGDWYSHGQESLFSVLMVHPNVLKDTFTYRVMFLTDTPLKMSLDWHPQNFLSGLILFTSPNTWMFFWSWGVPAWDFSRSGINISTGVKLHWLLVLQQTPNFWFKCAGMNKNPKKLKPSAMDLKNILNCLLGWIWRA